MITLFARLTNNFRSIYATVSPIGTPGPVAAAQWACYACYSQIAAIASKVGPEIGVKSLAFQRFIAGYRPCPNPVGAFSLRLSVALSVCGPPCLGVNYREARPAASPTAPASFLRSEPSASISIWEFQRSGDIYRARWCRLYLGDVRCAALL